MGSGVAAQTGESDSRAAGQNPSTAETVETPRGSGLRVAMYSHDTVGLGHLRRNLLIAQGLRGDAAVDSVLMVAGVSEGHWFPKASGIDFLTLPAFRKQGRGYETRSLRVPSPELRELRAETIRAALASYRPDVLIVDKVPFGVLEELRPVLEDLRSAGGTACVLGLRDVLDDPGSTRIEWAELGYEKAVADYYDAVWVYGDPKIYDPAREYALSPGVVQKIAYTGYLDPTAVEIERIQEYRTPPGPYVLCTVGGGEDGAALAGVFAATRRPDGMAGVVLTGPYFPDSARRALDRASAADPGLHVMGFLSDPIELVRRASRVISMGGYNTIVEVLSLAQRALIVPRVDPRSEQLLRAERLEELGLLDVCHPGDATPKAFEDWLSKDVPRPDVRGRVDLGGLGRIPFLLQELLGEGRMGARRAG